MPLPEDKTTLNFVLDKSTKHKLQILADADGLKLSPFVAKKLQEVVEDFEQQIRSKYGPDDFLEIYHTVFGNEYPPLISYKLEKIKSPEEARRVLIAAIGGVPRGRGAKIPGKQPPDFNVDLDELLEQADKNNKQEPSDE